MAVCSVISAQESKQQRDTVHRLDTVSVTAGTSVLPSPLLPAISLSSAPSENIVSAPSRVLPDVLRDVVGVQVQQTNAGHGTVILRGLTGNQVLILVDGVRLNNATIRDGPNQLLALIDPERIERVEVIRGPGSVLFGSDAMGGVVNVVTRRPALGASAAGALAYASSDDGLRSHIEGNVGGSRLRVRGGATLSRTRDLEAGGDIGIQPRTGFSSIAADAAAELEPFGCGQLSASLQGMDLRNVSRYDRLVDFRLDATALQSGRTGPDAEFLFEPQSHVMGVARYQGVGCRGPLPGHGLTVGTSIQREGRLQRAWEDDGSGGVGGGGGAAVPSPTRQYQRDDVRTNFASLYGERSSKRGITVRGGADVYHDVVSSNGYEETVSSGVRRPLLRISGADSIPAGRFPNAARSTTLGMFVHAAGLIGSRARLIVGVRHDMVRVIANAGDDFGGAVNDRSQKLSGQAGLSFFMGSRTTVSLNVGQGFRAANIYDRTTISTVPGGIVLPSPLLDQETSVTYELGVRHTTDRVNAGVVGYVTDVDGLIDRVLGSHRGDTLFMGRRVFRAANLGKARVSGVEASGDMQLKRDWSLRSQAFWTRGAQTVAGGSAEEPMGRIPPLSGSIAVRRNLLGNSGTGWIEGVARGAASQRRLSDRDRRDTRIQAGGTPGFFTLGLRGTWLLRRVRFSAGLENLFDRGYREHGSGIDSPGRHAWMRIDLKLQLTGDS